MAEDQTWAVDCDPPRARLAKRWRRRLGAIGVLPAHGGDLFDKRRVCYNHLQLSAEPPATMDRFLLPCGCHGSC